MHYCLCYWVDDANSKKNIPQVPCYSKIGQTKKCLWPVVRVRYSFYVFCPMVHGKEENTIHEVVLQPWRKESMIKRRRGGKKVHRKRRERACRCPEEKNSKYLTPCPDRINFLFPAFLFIKHTKLGVFSFLLCTATSKNVNIISTDSNDLFIICMVQEVIRCKHK